MNLLIDSFLDILLIGAMFYRRWRLFSNYSSKIWECFWVRFSFGLHIDDLPVLEYIKNQLKIGKISINSTRAKVTYNIIAKKDIAKIIAIFSEYNLN